jgi:hypothetical protein
LKKKLHFSTIVFTQRASSKRKKQQQKTQQSRNFESLELQTQTPSQILDMNRVKQLAKDNPDDTWKHWPPIDLINESNPMRLLSSKLKHSGSRTNFHSMLELF